MLDLRIDFDALADVSQKVATTGEEFQTWIYVKFLDTIFCPNSYFVFKFIPISF